MKATSSLLLTSALGLFLLFGSISSVYAQSKGRITGKVVESGSGEALFGANILIEGTTRGTTTDFEGAYTLTNLTPGTYTVVFRYITYTTVTITGVVVKADEATVVDVAMKSDAIGLSEITVTAEANRNTEGALMVVRQRSISISDAVSAEFISRAGAGDVGAAMSKVTGASVVDGKYVFVRGLGERYSSTHMNGIELPSADPDKKSFQLDLISTNLIDNITTIKTFTPDRPGNFSGGLVDVVTKSFPENKTFSFSMSTAYNSNVTLQNDFLTYEGSSTDWLGFDNGKRDVPAVIDQLGDLPTYSNSIRTNSELAHRLSAASKAFSTEMAPRRDVAIPNSSLNMSFGDQYTLFDNPVGVVLSGNYSNQYQYYANGTFERWFLAGRTDEVSGLTVDQDLADTKGSREVTLGALGSVSYKIGDNKFTANVMYNRAGESSARYLMGGWPSEIADDTYEARVLSYKERDILNRQVIGKHVFRSDLLGDVKLDWTGSWASTGQSEPALRMFANQFALVDDGAGVIDTLYRINTSSYDRPNHFYRNLTEDNRTLDVQLSIPIFKSRNNGESIRLGGFSSRADREMSERRFEVFTLGTAAAYSGDPSSYFSPSNMGITDSTRLSNGTYRYTFGNYITDASDLRNQYSGVQTVDALFAMFDVRPFDRFRVVTGLRYETTSMRIDSRDSTAMVGDIKVADMLPSLGLTYELTEKMNLRANYGRTLARPSFREIAPFYYFEFVGGYIYSGNPDLKRTLIDNYDVRWEWFPNPGDVMAVSLFHKEITNPIERTFLVESERFTHRNERSATVSGIELEFRKAFTIGEIHLLQPNVNVTLIHSDVDISADEKALIRSADPDGELSRPLFGQSPYIVNLDLTYINSRTRTSVTTLYNVFGARLHEVIVGATPDIYERSRQTLNLTIEQPLAERVKMKVSATNLLNDVHRFTVDYRGREHDFNRYTTGRAVSVSFSYGF